MPFYKYWACFFTVMFSHSIFAVSWLDLTDTPFLKQHKHYRTLTNSNQWILTFKCINYFPNESPYVYRINTKLDDLSWTRLWRWTLRKLPNKIKMIQKCCCNIVIGFVFYSKTKRLSLPAWSNEPYRRLLQEMQTGHEMHLKKAWNKVRLCIKKVSTTPH